jgi:enolase-phosphatase E1
VTSGPRLTLDVDAVVVDIEGTTSSTGFVTSTLYPYSRARFAHVLTERAGDPDVARAAGQVRDLLGEPGAGVDRIVSALHGWLDRDEKVTPLKTLQGLIWADGFAAGDLTAHVYDDVVPALRGWREAGLRLYVFSSGSLTAQATWFGHSPDGDLLPLFTDRFDTENAGPKRVDASYRAITAATGEDPAATVFLSDLGAELDAAREAGWLTVGVRRPGEPYADAGTPGHPEIARFDELTLRRRA